MVKTITALELENPGFKSQIYHFAAGQRWANCFPSLSFSICRMGLIPPSPQRLCGCPERVHMTPHSGCWMRGLLCRLPNAIHALVLFLFFPTENPNIPKGTEDSNGKSPLSELLA